MDSNNGYVYVRQHVYYNNDKICKLGKFKNIPDRDNSYTTLNLSENLCVDKELFYGTYV